VKSALLKYLTFSSHIVRISEENFFFLRIPVT